MEEKQELRFGSYRLGIPDGQLLQRKQVVPLPPKALAVLRYLSTHAGELVSKAELLEAVWPETVVSESVLTVCINALRQALGDEAKTPRYIATVHRQGYRFIGRIGSRQPAGKRTPQPTVRSQAPHAARSQLNSQQPTANTPPSVLIGRETELAQLRQLWDKVLSGQRQVVFVTGKAGIGKTTLVEAFLQTLNPSPQPRDPRAWIGHGQCVEQYGPGEAYLPLREALGRMCQGAGGDAVIIQLRHTAPDWLDQLQELHEDQSAEQQPGPGMTQERMLRELAVGIEGLARTQPVVLVLEDLQWSDQSTVAALAVLARRRETARLLLLGTYRPVDVIVHEHPLKVVKEELQLHEQCQEVVLGPLGETEVRQYVTQRFAAGDARSSLAAFIQRRSEGHPLFMVNLADHLAQMDGWAAASAAETAQRLTQLETTIPARLQQFIAIRLGQLQAGERQVLEAASVAGVEFSVASVAVGLAARDESDIEAVCEELARQEQFIEDRGLIVWPDGTATQRYGFRHALYQELLYAGMAEARRARLHRTIGEQVEAGYAGHTAGIAGELAVHFERGRDLERALHYRHEAGEQAQHRSAHQEALIHLTAGLALLERLPASPAQAQRELQLRTMRGASLIAAVGHGAPEVEHTYARAWQLCQQLGDHPSVFPVLCGLWSFYTARAHLPRATELATQLFALAQRQREPGVLLIAHSIQGQTRFFLGEPAAAHVHVEHNLAVYERQAHRSLIELYGEDPGVVCRGYGAAVCWLLGEPDRTRQLIDEGLELAHALAHPASVAQQLWAGAVRYQWCGDVGKVRELVQKLLCLDPDEVSPMWRAGSAISEGWVLVQHGQMEAGIAQMRQGLDDWRATGMELFRPYYLALLAEALRETGQITQGLEMLAEALGIVAETQERWYEAELYRLKGELLLNAERRTQHTRQAETCFQQALDIARQQRAKSLELRAAASLARLWQQQKKKAEAHALLAPVYHGFTEGFDTQDLQAAKALLSALC